MTGLCNEDCFDTRRKMVQPKYKDNLWFNGNTLTDS